MVETLMDFEAQSFRNLVHFYGDELRQIVEGARALELFTRAATVKLSKKNVLAVKNIGHSHGGRKILYVTPEAQALL